VFSVTGDLVELPDDAAAVCELISSFLESWNVTQPGLDLSLAENEVREAEYRLGLALPVALRWMLTNVGAGHNVIGRQDFLVHPRCLEIDDQGVLVYRVENQHCAKWGVRVDEIGYLDPPVIWKDLQAGAEWCSYQQRLSVDLLEMVFNEAMLSPEANVLQTELASGAPPELDSLPRLAIPEHVFWPLPEGPPVRWYGMRDCLIRNDGDVWLWAFGRTADDVNRATRAIPGEWTRSQE
jgi:hypothetical protein